MPLSQKVISLDMQNDALEQDIHDVTNFQRGNTGANTFLALHVGKQLQPPTWQDTDPHVEGAEKRAYPFRWVKAIEVKVKVLKQKQLLLL